MAGTQYDEIIPFVSLIQILPYCTTDWNEFGGSNLGRDWRTDSMIAINTDTIDHIVLLHLNVKNATPNDTSLWFGVNVPAGAGNGTVPAVDLIAEGLPSLVGGFAISKDLVWFARVTVAVNTSKAVTITCLCGEL